MNKAVARILAVLFSLALLFILLITSFEAVCYWTPGLYQHEFEKYHVLDDMVRWKGDVMDMDGLTEVMDGTMAFLRGDRGELQVEVPINGEIQGFYNEDEISHMTDVRDLFVAAIKLRRAAALLCLLILAILFGTMRRRAAGILGRGYVRTCLVVLVLSAGLGLLISTDFNKYFVIFHHIFFSQGNWMFDETKSRMIDIMPEGFFSDIALRIIVTFLISVAVLLIPAGFAAREPKQKESGRRTEK